MQDSKIGTFSAMSIGIGGMVGGGIFAVTGLTEESSGDAGKGSSDSLTDEADETLSDASTSG